MKKSGYMLLSVLACALLASTVSVTAQESGQDSQAEKKFENESEFYYHNVPILKIAPHKLGYYVIYRRNNLKTGEMFIPKEWLDRRDQRAVLNRTEDNIRPYVSVFFRNGEFDHVKLVVAKDISHPTWGVLQVGSLYDEKFKIETLNLEY